MDSTLAAAPLQPRVSVDLQRLKQQQQQPQQQLSGEVSHAFVAATSAHARARQHPEKGASVLLPGCCWIHINYAYILHCKHVP